jgi:hypothetical protein
MAGKKMGNLGLGKSTDGSQMRSQGSEIFKKAFAPRPGERRPSGKSLVKEGFKPVSGGKRKDNGF